MGFIERKESIISLYVERQHGMDAGGCPMALAQVERTDDGRGPPVAAMKNHTLVVHMAVTNEKLGTIN